MSLKFKRHWEKKAQGRSDEEIVFGAVLGAKWNWRLDRQAFSQLEAFLNIGNSQDILDVGCGPLARAEVYFSVEGYHIVGVDISRTILKKAKENIGKYGDAENVDFVLGDAEFLPFRRNTFSVILCIGTISHLPTIASVKRAVKEMKSVIKLCGRIYIPWWINRYSLFGIQDTVLLKALDMLNIEHAQYLKFHGLTQLNAIFTSAGLTIKHIRYGNLIEFPQSIFYFSPNILKKLLDTIGNVFNRFHKRNGLLSSYSSTFEVTCENIASQQQLVKAESYYQFL